MVGKAFITGSTGFLGAAIARALQAEGFEVSALCRSHESAEKATKLSYVPVNGDLAESGSWLESVGEANVVVHAAHVRPGMRLSKGWLEKAREVRNHGVDNMLTAARNGKVCKSFIYTSGIAVIGDHGDEWVDENSSLRPSAIGHFHQEGERKMLAAAQSGMAAYSMRPGFVYGADGSFEKFFLAEAAKGTYRYPGNGSNYISWIHVDDVARGYMAAIKRPPVGKAVNLVDDQPLRMDDFAKLLLDAFGGGRAQKVPRFLVSLLAGAPLAEILTSSYRVRNTRAKELLDWLPQYPSFAQGIVDVVKSYQGPNSVDGEMQWGQK